MPAFKPSLPTAPPWIKWTRRLFSNPCSQLPPSLSQGILSVRENLCRHACEIQTRSVRGVAAQCCPACPHPGPESSTGKKAPRRSSRSSIDPLPHFYPRLWQRSQLEPPYRTDRKSTRLNSSHP